MIDRIFLQVGKTAVGIDADILDIYQRVSSPLWRAQSAMYSIVPSSSSVSLQQARCNVPSTPILAHAAVNASCSELNWSLPSRNQAAFDRLFQPDPLEHAGFV